MYDLREELVPLKVLVVAQHFLHHFFTKESEALEFLRVGY